MRQSFFRYHFFPLNKTGDLELVEKTNGGENEIIENQVLSEIDLFIIRCDCYEK